MKTEIKQTPIDERIRLGDAAKQLLADPFFNSVLKTATKINMDALLACAPGTDEAVMAHSKLLGLNDLKNLLRSIESDGVMARAR